ncbi:MAG: hypothetical protein WC465_04885 [Patescibacteria group bacterium]
MTTCADIILLALKDINLIDENETPSASTLADAFSTLKQMLSIWQVDGNSIYAIQDVTFAPTGALSYTIGIGGVVSSVARPDDIRYCYHVIDGLSYPMLDRLSTREEYESIGLKTLAGIPYCFYYEKSFPTGTLFIYPQPTTGTIHFGIDVPFTSYTAAANDLSLPAEYDMTIRFNLAAILGDTMGVGVPEKVERLARETKQVMERNNLKIPRNTSRHYISKEARFNGYI